WDIDDDAKRNTELARHSYGLYPAFIDGMLDAAGPSITITDGNESAYYYEDTETFFSARQGMKTDALSMVAPENVPEYRAHVRVANALYVDHLFNLRTQEYLSAYMTPEERAKWFEHNVYYALRTSDEFVWLYSEKMNWWTDEGLPPGLEEAVISARGKIAAREPLGYDIAPMIEEARAREEAAIREALVTRSAEIARVAGEVPTIDGVLSDAAWASVEPLEPMLPTLRGRTDEPAQTECRVTYDDKAMYFALRCVEPQTEAIVAIGDGRDDSVWLGDSVDIFIEPSAQAPTHYHFIIGAGGVAWDARVTDAQDLEYDPTWQHAVNIGTGEWTVEASIPWAAVGMAPPKAGATCRANICRQRASVGGELSSWSQCVGGFVEPDSFGSWVLR
ncbi:MAG TPA: sugar-binding protein, partial [Armatimonadota bacterium]|nr:sugar-binding protein [Armatimonadota bacterium]